MKLSMKRCLVMLMLALSISLASVCPARCGDMENPGFAAPAPVVSAPAPANWYVTFMVINWMASLAP